LAAPANRVWTALTDADELAQWFWPKSFATNVFTDPHPGGAFTIRSVPMEMGVSGRYETVEAPYRLTFSWQWDGEADSSRVQIHLTDQGDRTELALTHGGLLTDEQRTAHIQGWNDCLDRLPLWLASD